MIPRSNFDIPSAGMSKAFVREETADEDAEPADAEEALAPAAKNYLTPAGYRRLREEFAQLWEVERPKLVETIAWAASNGDRSENGDYIYGKRRLREIDRRIRHLSRRLEVAEVVDNAGQGHDRVFFGATVTVAGGDGRERTVTIVGIDEADPLAGRISWIAPLARALLKARERDVVQVRTPAGVEEV
jgi:transcription elongation factor GreB